MCACACVRQRISCPGFGSVVVTHRPGKWRTVIPRFIRTASKAASHVGPRLRLHFKCCQSHSDNHFRLLEVSFPPGKTKNKQSAPQSALKKDGKRALFGARCPTRRGASIIATITVTFVALALDYVCVRACLCGWHVFHAENTSGTLGPV